MKNTIKLVTVFALVAFCANVTAQNIKLAHIDKSALVVSMPEFEAAQESLQKYGQSLSDEIEEIEVELRRKWDEFQKVQESLQELVRQSRLEDIQAMGERLERFQQNAQVLYQQEQEKLLQPVIEKADRAIEAVAKEQGITYVINGDPQILIFKAVGTIDLLPAVKQHLGIRD